MHDILLGIAGRPVFHSKSPLIFRSIFKERGIDGVYFRILCSDEQKLFSIIASLEISGVNATSPLKEKIFASLTECDESAKISKSVNCIKNSNGKLIGFSTDHHGVVTPLKNVTELKNAKIIIAGAGGAARAAVTGLRKFSENITIINRTEEKARNIAEEFGCSWRGFDSSDEVMSECEILVSTLPSGVDVPYLEKLPGNTVLFDANYKNSLLGQYALEKGLKFISGEKWLVNQAIPAFNIFLDENLDSFDADISSDITYDKSIIVLTGFMCSGKTTVGKQISEKLGYEFVDMDREIEQRCCMSVNEIFNKHGESYFRSVEKDLLRELCSRDKLVISTGGGIVIDRENRSLLKEKLTIWIYSEIGKSVSRDNGTRPLLSADDKFAAANKIFNDRKKLYADCCSFMAYNDGTIDEIVKELYEEISHI